MKSILVWLCLMLLVGTAEAKHRQHHSHNYHSLVSSINYKLAKWVHPTGKCGFGYTERLATYYNSGHHTANGERFYPNGHTAAHRKLPFGTKLSVMNPHTGKSISVRINDRGPFTNAWIDLAQGAAFSLGMRSSSYVCVSSGQFADAI
jgi:rare lipoprotein A